MSDTGTISGEGWLIEIEDTRRPVGGLIVHMGEVVEGTPKEATLYMQRSMPNDAAISPVTIQVHTSFQRCPACEARHPCSAARLTRGS